MLLSSFYHRISGLLVLLLVTASCATLPQRVQPEVQDQETAFIPPEIEEVHMRVKLFDRNQPKGLTIAATRGVVRLAGSDGTQIILSPASAPVSIKPRAQGVLELHHGGHVSAARSWLAEASKDGLIRVVHPVTGWLNYHGSITFSHESGGLEAINTVGLEDYVASVTGSEMNFTNPEALKVQSVIARTYALWNLDRDGSKAWDVTDSEMNQVYKGEIMFTDRYRKATEATHGEVVTWADELILAVYHSTCGGQTAGNETVWSGDALPYLRGVRDHPSCSASPHFRWDTQVNKDELRQAIGISGPLDLEFDIHGRVKNVRAETSSGNRSWGGNQFRLEFNRHFGAFGLRSTFFELEEDENTYIFRGKGLGHGTGLCQWGALGLAESGWNYKDILRFYYNGTEIKHISQIPALSREFPGL